MFKFLQRFRQTGQAQTTPGKLPQVMLFGFERSYGAPHPQDFSRLIQEYKSWPYACATKNAYSVAKCKLNLYTKVAGELSKIEEHPFLDLMKNVNPFSNYLEMWAITVIYLEMTGNSYWWMPKNNLRIPQAIWNIPSHWMRVIPSETEFISGYIMMVPGRQATPIPFDAEDIVHFKYPSPFNLYYGLAPAWAAQYGIDMNDELKTWGINYFKNNAQPGGVLTTEQPLPEDSYQRLRDEWNRKHKGSENSGKIAILESGLKFETTGASMRDAKIEEPSREIRDEIFAIFGVPASKLGLVEDVNRANADANDYSYNKETVLPKLLLLEEKINEKVMPMYDVGLVAKFESPVPDDKDYRLRERESNIKSGYSSIDDERIKDDLEPYELPQTEVPLIPFGVIPAGQEASTTPMDSFGNPTSNNQDGNKDEPKKLFKSARHERKWETFAMLTAPQEKHYTEVMRRFFQMQHAEVMKQVNKHRGVKDVKASIQSNVPFENMNEANNRIKIMSTLAVREALVSGIRLGATEIGHTIDFNIYEAHILRALERRLNKIKDVNDTTYNLIKQEMAKSIQLGESIDEAAARIDKVYKFSEDFRSTRIAQTEIIGSTNEGQLMAWIDAGVEYKEWITARDEKVRDSHRRMEGKIIKSSEYFHLVDFKTGNQCDLSVPGDASTGAPAEFVINCRCTPIAVHKKE
jgi:HK97 family phage portal protein